LDKDTWLPGLPISWNILNPEDLRIPECWRKDKPKTLKYFDEEEEIISCEYDDAQLMAGSGMRCCKGILAVLKLVHCNKIPFILN